MIKSTKNIVIKTQSIVINLSPLGFHGYAKEFHSAAVSYKPIDGFSPVPYYLYCRSLELLLKAYLLTKGVTKEKLKKKYNHNLNKAFRKSKELGIGQFLEISEEEQQNIKIANDYYAKKGFEYFEVTRAVKGYKGLPELEVLKSLSEKLIDKLHELCKNA